MRKLALVKTFEYEPQVNGTFLKENEPCWREIYQYEGKWEFWCGRVGIISSHKPEIIRLVDLPA